ncbi:MAG: TetR/AcrR family transcriptional regulator [Actinobacteria bacterium]|nr:TetR/AcrR family transcriptional regulator [Actinomycetota bacterium]
MKISALGDTGPARRAPLTRQRVVAAAVELADRDGIDSISMRRLAQELGVEAMSLYTHVQNKNDLLDGMADAVVSEIPLSVDGANWRMALRQLVLAARAVMLSHPWAPQTIETRIAPGPAALSYINAVLGILRGGGFSVAQAHHALHIAGSRLVGFAQALYDDSGNLDPELAAVLESQLGATHPHLVEMAIAATHSGVLGPCDDDAEFAFALDFILDGLDRLRRG